MAFTPLIKPLNPQGTTFYTFSSAARDLSKCMANTQKEIVFSHFVCINIPDFINTSNYEHGSTTPNNSGLVPASIDRNLTQLGGVHHLLDRSAGSVKPTSQLLAESLQDYVFNYEELLISNSTDNTTDRSVAERVFWHWLAQTGAINWTFDQAKIAPALQNAQEVRFVEGYEAGGYAYENVVKYIGTIDITNNVDIANEAYTEIYVHIPSEHGSTPVVLFEQEFDDNFNDGATSQVFNNKQDYILGQDASTYDTHPVDERALYDVQDDHQYVNASSYGWGSTPSTTTDSYSPSANNGVNLYKTVIDGLCIDFNTNSYADIVLNHIANMDEFNKTGDSFEFNAVLVYYDIVDVSAGTKTSNLYGILFLDDVKSESWDYFQRYPKYKPVAGMQNGNSYGFKLNLRIDIEPDKNGITSLVNEYNTFSMSLFADAIARMQDSVEMFTKTRGSLSSIEDRLSALELLMASISDYEQLSQRVQELSDSLENANLAFADRNSLIDLIANLSDRIDSIMNGRANVSLQYNTDVIRSGYNTYVDSSTPNMVTINSSDNGYNIMKTTLNNGGGIIDKDHPMVLNDQTRTDNDVYTILKPASNMLRIHTDDSIPAVYDIKIYIDSTLNNWREGQNIRLVFPSLSVNTLNGKNIMIYTGETYDLADTVFASEMTHDNPIIEFTCLDPTFSSSENIVHDVIR